MWNYTSVEVVEKQDTVVGNVLQMIGKNIWTFVLKCKRKEARNKNVSKKISYNIYGEGLIIIVFKLYSMQIKLTILY